VGAVRAREHGGCWPTLRGFRTPSGRDEQDRLEHWEHQREWDIDEADDQRECDDHELEEELDDNDIE
jgi:hypothetical protein